MSSGLEFEGKSVIGRLRSRCRTRVWQAGIAVFCGSVQITKAFDWLVVAKSRRIRNV